MKEQKRVLKQSVGYRRYRLEAPGTPLFTKRSSHSFLSCSSRSSMNVTSASSRIEFFETFRTIGKKDSDKVQSPSIAYLRTCDKEKLSPKPFSLVEKSASSNIEIRNRISDRYTKPYAQALNNTLSLKRLNLKGSNLKSASSSIILQNLNSKFLLELDLSENTLGTAGASQLAKLLLQDSCKLQTLEIESCSIADVTLSIICKAIEINQTLKHLNLAKNTFRDGVCLGKMLKSNYSLKSLDLHWNGLRGSPELFEGLEKNESLLELDLSWNSLGVDPLRSAEALCNFLRNNKDMRHLDLSFNSLDRETCKRIGKALENNHSIYGLHIVGNHASIDAQGFLHELEAPNTNVSHFKRILTEKRTGESCWICEKWVEVEIPIPDDETRYVHLEVDNYEPCFIEIVEDKHLLSRFLPQVPIQLYFTDVYNETVLHKDIPQITHKRLKKMNVLKPSGNPCSAEISFATKPRAKYEPPTSDDSSIDTEEEPWSLERSIFKDCIFESTELTNQCFEFDWEHSRIPNLYTSDEHRNNCKELLRKWYPYIKNTYKRLSIVSFVEVFGINSNTLHEFLMNQKLFDSKFRVSDLGVHWSATLNKASKHKFKSRSGLCRSDFLEILVRIAINKYSEQFGIYRLIEKMQNALIENNPNEWRVNCYFCEEVDDIIKTNESLLEHLFKIFAKQKVSSKKKYAMSFEEFKEFTFILGEKIQRHAGNIFISSLFTRVNELDYNDHMEMTLLEFYEALMRLIDINCTGKNLQEKFEEALPVLRGIVNSHRRGSSSYRNTNGQNSLSNRGINLRKYNVKYI